MLKKCGIKSQNFELDHVDVYAKSRHGKGKVFVHAYGTKSAARFATGNPYGYNGYGHYDRLDFNVPHKFHRGAAVEQPWQIHTKGSLKVDHVVMTLTPKRHIRGGWGNKPKGHDHSTVQSCGMTCVKQGDNRVVLTPTQSKRHYNIRQALQQCFPVEQVHNMSVVSGKVQAHGYGHAVLNVGQYSNYMAFGSIYSTGRQSKSFYAGQRNQRGQWHVGLQGSSLQVDQVVLNLQDTSRRY